jgi:two-component system, OmpR family, sensor kinase
VSRLPIRLKVTLAFAAAMAVVLGLTGLVVYERFESSLNTTFDDGLRSRADEVVALSGPEGRSLGTTSVRRLVERGESFAQVVDRNGRVLGATPPLGDRPLLEREALRSLSRPAFFERDEVAGLEDPVRLYARPVGEAHTVVIVGAARDDRDEALQSLAALLLAGGPLALLLASLAGYGVAGVALRPVEEMRRRAAEISELGSRERLPVPPADDELGRLGATLNAMLGRLERSAERERRFVADASHELRTPLALLKSELELASREGRSADELRAAVASAAEETERLVRLAENLLVLARLDEEKLAVLREQVDVDALLAGAAQAFGERAPIELGPQTGARIDADRVQLERALANLLDNAHRHGAQPIELYAEAVDGRVELHVRDGGPGFPPEELPRAFERFAGSASADGHAGLGLAIVESVAKAHGGAAGAQNRSEGGADVWIALPLS